VGPARSRPHLFHINLKETNMSDAAVATKSAKSSKTAETVAPSVKPAVELLRKVQPKQFSPSSLQPLGYGETEILTATAPKEWTFADVMNPVAWANVAARVARNPLNTTVDKIGSKIFLETESGSFSAVLRIRGIVRNNLGNPCGLDLICIGPSIDIKTGVARPIDLNTGKAWVDPVKVED
jgi:hypothetical protein